jgi:hypothetical protein
MKKEDISNIAVAVSDSQQGHWDAVHGRMEGMLVSLNTIVNQGAKLLQRTEPATVAPRGRLCADCAHCRPRRHFFVFKSYQFAKCARPSSTEEGMLVSGEGGYYCSTERSNLNDSPKWCGREGRFFVPPKGRTL